MGKSMKKITNTKNNISNELINALVSNRVGLVNSISEIGIDADDPAIFHYTSQLSNVAHIYGQPQHSTNGGAGLNRSSARSAAIGESLERYCLSYIDQNKLIFSSHKDIIKKNYNAVDLNKFAIFSDKQYSIKDFMFKKPTLDSKMNWIQGYSVIDKALVLVPACMIYIPYPHPGNTNFLHLLNTDEDRYASAVSTGTSCASSIKEAVLKGIYEVIERDAFVITWLNKLPVPLMNISSGKTISKIFSKIFAPSKLKFYIFDISTDISIPVMCAFIIDELNEDLAVSVGASANLNPEKAALKALIEAAQGRIYLKSTKSKIKKRYSEDYRNVNTFDDHVMLFSKRESIKNLDFLTNNSSTKNFSEFNEITEDNDVESSLQICKDKIKSSGMDIIATDLTTIDVREFGLYVCKILIPGMQELNGDHNYIRFGGNRLYKVPIRKGYHSHALSEDQMNKIPHPFP